MNKILQIFMTLLVSGFISYANEAGMLAPTPYSQIPVTKAKMIEFGATSCRSCQIMDRLLYDLKKEKPSLPLYFVNVMKERDVAIQFKIRMIPTQIFFDNNGKVVFSHIGLLSRDELIKKLKEYGIYK